MCEFSSHRVFSVKPIRISEFSHQGCLTNAVGQSVDSVDGFFDANFGDLIFISYGGSVYKTGLSCDPAMYASYSYSYYSSYSSSSSLWSSSSSFSSSSSSELSFDSLPWEGEFDAWVFLPQTTVEQMDGFSDIPGPGRIGLSAF